MNARARRAPTPTPNGTPIDTSASIAAWFAAQGWQPFEFQREVWRAIAAGRSGMLHADTGAGKTYAVWLGALQAFAGPSSPTPSAPSAPALTVLWLTPMRALATDTLKALQNSLAALSEFDPGLARWTVGMRTADTTGAQRSAQARRLPSALVTTPESLSLLLARADSREALRSVRLVVVDEWHELVGSKRGVQAQLALARLAGWNPQLRIWGMSATLGDLGAAMRALLGQARADAGVLVRGDTGKSRVIDTLIPERPDRFAWAGHLGLKMLPQVVRELDSAPTTLIFVNVRSQAEVWYKALLDLRPDWAGLLAIHHGSLDAGVRDWVERGLKGGTLRAVVCTSSLDLGVDFLPVDRVLQIGSTKGIARLLQRLGRSGHAPGRPSRITLVPTNSFELIEAAAARAAVSQGRVESRESPRAPIDVLVQHLATVALGGGFLPDALYAEVRTTAAYRDLSPEAWQWCLDFVSRGGAALEAYPDYHRVIPGSDDDPLWRLTDARLARRHRANIGVIVSDASLSVQFAHGGRLGTLEESFLARLSPGDSFIFAGRQLELVRIHQMTAFVKLAAPGKSVVPRWAGSRMPLSTVLADCVLEQFALAAEGRFDSPEMQSVRPLLELQRQWSALPTPHTLLAETLRTREGWHLFLYPFAGRHAHAGLASLFAWRAARRSPGTFSIAVNDYGFELLSADERDWAALLPELRALGSTDELAAELRASLNATEMARRRFREIARVAGLVFQSHPGEHRSARQLQASSQLFFDVFRQYDPDNLLLRQADAEVLEQELDVVQLERALHRMETQALVVRPLRRPGPLAFPLLVERFREKLSTEQLADRIARMLRQLETAAGQGADASADTVSTEVGEVGESLAFSSVPKPARAARRRPRQPSRRLPPL